MRVAIESIIRDLQREQSAGSPLGSACTRMRTHCMRACVSGAQHGGRALCCARAGGVCALPCPVRACDPARHAAYARCTYRCISTTHACPFRSDSRARVTVCGLAPQRPRRRPSLRAPTRSARPRAATCSERKTRRRLPTRSLAAPCAADSTRVAATGARGSLAPAFECRGSGSGRYRAAANISGGAWVGRPGLVRPCREARRPQLEV
jgi:hypothetical protein